MTMLRESLNSFDALFLELEQLNEGALMHTGAALIFDPRADGGAPSHQDLVALLEERLGMLPRLSTRLSEPRVGGLRRPAWVSDPTFDLTAHVRHATLPGPGSHSELHEWLGDFWSHRLDRARPLWEMTLVDGLEGGRWMLATKMHHAMVDGVGAMGIGYVLLDTEPRPGPRPSPQPSEPDAGTDRCQLLGLLSPAVAAARAAIHIALHPRRLVRAGEAAVAMGNVLWQVRATRESSLNVPIGTTRRFTSVSIDLAAVTQIRQALGGTVNDTMLALTTGALRRLLTQRDEPLERPLRAQVPVNTRGDDHTSPGNQVSSLFVDLPIGEPDDRRRYERTRAATEALKSGTRALGASTIFAIAQPVPPVLTARIAEMLVAARLFNITITNIPGPQFPLYALGARVRGILPLVPLAADHALALAMFSYDGKVFFGINADRAAMPDLDVVQSALLDEFSALLSLARRKGEQRSPRA
jgi:WS/DGAT/MGAT family acyltransferase